ncbi:unnamed protein product [Somion occarium]|uniref:DUF6533 domain-containing protein n=1 Tax=Somion occarium TaxID=3059160 RepID=A0ABP1E081_9APHY
MDCRERTKLAVLQATALASLQNVVKGVKIAVEEEEECWTISNPHLLSKAGRLMTVLVIVIAADLLAIWHRFSEEDRTVCILCSCLVILMSLLRRHCVQQRRTCILPEGALAYVQWMFRHLVGMIASNTPPTLVEDVGQTRVTVYIGFMSFMILIWEHIITFGDEVEYIWKGRKGPIVWLFFLNRYLTPLGFIINLFAYLSPSWTQEGAMIVVGLNITALMMFLRVYALYPTRYVVLAVVGIVFCAELAVNAWLTSHGQAVVHNSQIHACTMVFDPSIGAIASASAWLPLLYDTIVFILIVKRTLQPVRRHAAGKIIKVLLRDGVLYYSVIFSRSWNNY